MDWLTAATLFIGNLAIILPLFLWNSSESRTDNRRVLDLTGSIDKEMKDFHGRLCKLEEKYCQMMERFLENKK